MERTNYALTIQLKNGDKVDAKMLSNKGDLFQINEKYWTYIIANMFKQGLIEGITIEKAWENVQMIENIEDCMITPKGIEYLIDNSFIEKAKQFLKDIKEITPS